MTPNASTLAEEGFLADEAADVVQGVRVRYAEHLAELRAINRLVTSAQYKLSVHRENVREMTAAVLLIRSLQHCQAAIILLERGMAPSARAVIRCALEGLFNLGACVADQERARAFVDADQTDCKRKLKYLEGVEGPLARAQLDPPQVAAMIAQIQTEIDSTGARELKARQMAEDAGLGDLYRTAYAVLSGSVHSSIGDLEEHVQTNPDGRTMELITEPITGGLDWYMQILGVTMFELVQAAAKVFPMDIAESCEQHVARLVDDCKTG